MLGKMIPYGKIPFFWTRNYNKNLLVVGHHNGFDEVHMTGSPYEKDFLAYYIKDGKVVSAAANLGNNNIFVI